MIGFKLELGFVTDGDGMALPDEAFITFNEGRGSIEIEGAGAHDLGPILAAAPDMLAALKSLCDADATYVVNKIQIDCDSHGDAIRRMRIAREAIAKAEGRAP